MPLFLSLLLALGTVVEWQPGTLQVDESTQIVYQQRPGPGAVLVLIPGSFGDVHVYEDVAPLLHPELHLIVVELRGHGGSWPPAAEPSIELFAEDVLKIVDRLGVEHWYVGGHSIGGMIAVELAARRPEHLQGIISIEGWTHHEVQREAFEGKDGPTLTAEEEAKRVQRRERVTKHLTEAQQKSFATAWRKWDGLPILESTKVPVLQIWGDRGSGPKPHAVMRIPDRPNIRLEWLEGAGHSLLIQRPRETAALINAFINTATSPPAAASSAPSSSPE